MIATAPTGESDILHRLVFPFDKDLDPQAARSLLLIRFDRSTTKHINQLLRKNQRGTISADERIALDKFIRMGKFIDVLQAKARKALKEAGQSV